MTTADLQDKKDGLELKVLFESDDPRNQAIIRAFTQQLSDCLSQFIDPELGDADALWARAKAIGLVDTMRNMGVKMAKIEEVTRQTARHSVKQNLGY